jgi:hypothetical protein
LATYGEFRDEPVEAVMMLDEAHVPGRGKRHDAAGYDQRINLFPSPTKRGVD